MEPGSGEVIARTTRALLRCLACAGGREGKGFDRVYNMKTEEPKGGREFRVAWLYAYAPLYLSAVMGDRGWLGRSVSQRSYSSQGANAAWTRETFSRRDFGLVVLGFVVESRTFTWLAKFWWPPTVPSLPQRVSDIAAWREGQTEKWGQAQGWIADTSMSLLRMYLYSDVRKFTSGIGAR